MVSDLITDPYDDEAMTNNTKNACIGAGSWGKPCSEFQLLGCSVLDLRHKE